MGSFRQIELLIGPLADYQGGDANQAYRIVTTGDQDELHVRFNIKKTILGAPNSSTIVVDNLAENTRQRIRQNLTSAQLSVSSGQDMRIIFSGGVLSSVSTPRWPVIETSINALDGFGAMTFGQFRRTYSTSVAISDVLREIASTFPGVTVGNVDVDGFLGPKGGSYYGRAQNILDNLADNWGFSWSIQNGVFQAYQDNRTSNRSFLISHRSGTLISAVPILNGPLQQVTGVEITTRLDPRIIPGDSITLESNVAPDLDGEYKATTVEYNGDSHGTTWETKIQCLSNVFGEQAYL